MRLLVNRKVVQGPWGGGNKFVRGIYEHAHEFGVDIVSEMSSNIDAALMINPYPGDLGIGINEIIRLKMSNPKIKLIHRVNDHDFSRIPYDGRNDNINIECSKYCDGTVFVSDWVKNYYQEKSWHCENLSIIHNGVDKSIFKKSHNKISKTNKKINIVSHHWSTNEGKGFKIYEALDEFCQKNNDKFTFTYIGRHPNRFKHSKVVKPLFGVELGNELSKYDLYVSASRYESGPNHVLEALACDIPVLITEESGGGLEFVDSENHFSDWPSLEEKILSSDYTTEINYQPYSMKDCVGKYVEYIKGLINEPRY